MELKIEYLPVGKLKAYDRNTRKHQEKDVTEIAKSIEKYGFSDPIGVWGEKNIIVEGHGRLLAARKLGIETVPVIHLDHLTDEERREYAIMHNRTAELSGWDFEMLAKEMEELDLSEFDLDIAGFDMEDNDFDTQELEEVEAPEPPAEPTAKPGQIYQLGRHRLMCGDSTNPKDVERLMDGEMADALITDPPYNVNYEGGTDEQGIIRCGDNGIFKGVPTTEEQKKLSGIVRTLYEENPHDGKYIIDGDRVIACQSHAKTEDIAEELWFKWGIEDKEVNPLGDWEGGTDVDTGATNRKLGSDMGDAVTGGGLHGKDLSKADVSVNIYAHIKAQEEQKEIRLCCAIGDEMIDGKPYSEIVEIARDYIKKIGGFEKLAEWGLI